ncbi:MmcQ/YjbR family DNA-binding protein [Streptomyces sp. NPDC101455]|uniref:MmcQ/YjbR family DNA-binding protein n=1 Tax=Streptomyces sp. NPDC101455 TaxID=3366142 RepID=UPI0037FC3DAC
MNGKKLQQTAAECAEGLPGTALEHPFGEEWDVHKVRGKVFMLTTDVTGEPLVILKSAPDEAAALREQHAEITPGYHMNKRHWITLHGGDSLDRGLVEDWVTDSYDLALDSAPRSRRPAART